MIYNTESLNIYQTWENSSKPSNEWSGFVKIDFSTSSEPRAKGHTDGWRGVPFLNVNKELM